MNKLPVGLYLFFRGIMDPPAIHISWKNPGGIRPESRDKQVPEAPLQNSTTFCARLGPGHSSVSLAYWTLRRTVGRTRREEKGKLGMLARQSKGKRCARKWGSCS